MNEVIRALKERRSIRSYRTEQVREEDLQQILEAATYAPSGMGAQPVILVAVQDPATIARLSQLNAAVMGTKTDPFYGAPTVVVVLADQSRATWLEDGSLAMGNLMLAAHALGLGSCYQGSFKAGLLAPGNEALLAELNLPAGYTPLYALAVGYAAEHPEPTPRKENCVNCVG